jgi:uncharacterized repeat protein (TIGR01451 family)
VSAVGDVITYDFRVTNTGNVTLKAISLSDEQAAPAGPLTSGPTCPSVSLLPGETMDCAATYTVTQADLDAHPVNGAVTIKDTATVTGTAPDGRALDSHSSASVPVAQTPSIDLTKSVASPTGPVSAVGDTITYDFHVTNTGNVTLSGISISDQQVPPAGALTSGPTCPDESLAPGASMDCTASYTVRQADLDAGSINDTATAAGTAPDGDRYTSEERSASVPVTQTPSIDLIKSVSSPTAPVSAVGTLITYNFHVTNTGNVRVTDVAVHEGSFNGRGTLSAVTCPNPPVSLSPGESVDCTATYIVVASDLEVGKLSNTATATAYGVEGVTATSPASTATTVVQAAASGTGPDDSLPPTGGTLGASLYVGLVALGLIGFGLALRRGRERKRAGN